MSKWSFEWNPHRVWLAIFGGWVLLLSGALSPWVGGPGLLQLFRLRSLLGHHQGRLSEVEGQVLSLSSDQVRLERNSATQQREIRRVLGYVRSDEMVFDFSAQLPAQRVAPKAPSTTVAKR